MVEAKFTPRSHFNGFKGILHGGIISSVLDDAMDWAIHSGTKKWYVTTQMTINFKKSGPVEEQLTVKGWMVDEEGNPHPYVEGMKVRKIQYAKAELLNNKNEVIACSEGKFFQLPDEKVENQETI
jgi:acyl-coenzyme A thioesterase PaaI-like protein